LSEQIEWRPDMIKTTLRSTEEIKPVARIERRPEETLTEEQLEAVTGGLLPRGFIRPVILIG